MIVIGKSSIKYSNSIASRTADKTQFIRKNTNTLNILVNVLRYSLQTINVIIQPI